MAWDIVNKQLLQVLSVASRAQKEKKKEEKHMKQSVNRHKFVMFLSLGHWIVSILVRSRILSFGQKIHRLGTESTLRARTKTKSTRTS